jgi:hypothetical protein
MIIESVMQLRLGLLMKTGLPIAPQSPTGPGSTWNDVFQPYAIIQPPVGCRRHRSEGDPI